MAQLGVVDNLDPQAQVLLLRLMGGDEPEYWLGFDDFYVITRYGHSRLYAMAVYQLGQEIMKSIRVPLGNFSRCLAIVAAGSLLLIGCASPLGLPQPATPSATLHQCLSGSAGAFSKTARSRVALPRGPTGAYEVWVSNIEYYLLR